MTALTLLGALSAAVLVFEILDGGVFRRSPSGRLRGVTADLPGTAPARRRSGWEAILIVLLPSHFPAAGGAARSDVVDLLRRAGYPYRTTGEFFAAAIRTFSFSLVIGSLLAGVLMAAGAGLAAAVSVAGAFVILGLRRPYSRLRRLIRKRAAALRSNMLAGLALLNALLSAGVGAQESLRRSAGIGGPFCNLLGLLVAQMEVSAFSKAIETVHAHLPDPRDVEAGLFLRAVRDYYSHNHPLLPSVQALQVAVHREVLEATEARAALVRQRSGLFGVLAVLGLVITIIAPFVGVFTAY